MLIPILITLGTSLCCSGGKVTILEILNEGMTEYQEECNRRRPQRERRHIWGELPMDISACAVAILHGSR